MRLFDEGQRTDTDPGPRAEPLFRGLNRIAGPTYDAVRALLESWFDRFPHDAQAQLRGDFRATDARQSLGAFWELYVHEVHRRLGYELERDPQLPDTSRRPDFLARRGNHAFYLEATVVTYTDTEMAAHTRWNVILDLIGKAFNPDFSVAVNVKVAGQQTPAKRDVIPRVESWLATLDWATATRGGDPPAEITLPVRDWVLALRAHPKPPAHRDDSTYPTVIINGVLPSLVDDRQYLEDNLRDKSKYGKPHHPLVIAALFHRNIVTDRLIEWALYGPETVLVPVVAGVGQIDDASTSRNPRGLWQRGAEPQITRVSAVLTATHLGPLGIADCDLTLWKNPWAARPLHDEHPWRTISGDLEYNRLITTDPTTSAREILGPTPDWPTASDAS